MKKKHLWILAAVLLLVVALVWVLWSNLTVGLTEITITEKNLPKPFHGLKIAHVSDLHNSHLWMQTVEQLQEARPDIICITGDIVDTNHTDVDVALAFAAEAVKIAPCYYITGNHELKLDEAEYDKLITRLKALGITVLENETITLKRADAQICLAGVSWDASLDAGQLSVHDSYQVLLAHDPKHFEDYAQAGYDLVLSGHIHGGQFRLPFIGGLYGPGQGLLPEYDSGVYTSARTDMVVSRGIGNSVIPVRFNNCPEVILITLMRG